MLRIKIGNTWANTKEVLIPVTLCSPLFLSNGRIPGSYLFNFTLPLDEPMKAETGYVHRPSRHGTALIKRDFFLDFGPLKFYGTAKITQASETEIEVSCPINTGNLSSLLKELTMPDINLGGVRDTPNNLLTITFVLHTSIHYGSLSLQLKINNEVFETQSIENTELINTLSFTVNVNSADVISWSLIAVAEHISSNPDEYAIWFEINTGSSILVKLNDVTQVLSELSASVTYNNNQLNGGATISFLLPFDDITTNVNNVLNANGLDITWINEAFNNFLTLSYPNADFAIFPIENENLLDALDDDTYEIDHLGIKEIYNKYFPVINYYKNGGFPSIMRGILYEISGETVSAYNLFCPFPYLAYFIKRLAIQLQVQIINNVFEADDLKQLVIYNAFAENNYLTSDLLHVIDGYDLANHVPDIKISDFLNEILKLLAIGIDYDSQNKLLKLVNLKDIIADSSSITFPGVIISQPRLEASTYSGYRLIQPKTDSFASETFKDISELNYKGEVNIWNNLPNSGNEINDCYYVTMRREYYVWAYDKELNILNWIFFSNDFIHKIEAIDETDDSEVYEIDAQWGACMMKGYPLLDNQFCAPENRFWLIPKVKETGNFEGMPPDFTTDFSKYLLFYRGMQPDSQNNNYPLGSNDVYDYAGNLISGANLSLRWNGQYGLWENRHRHWVEWLMKTPGSFFWNASMSPLQLSKINWFKWYNANGTKYLLKKLTFNLYNDHIGQVEVEAFPR